MRCLIFPIDEWSARDDAPLPSISRIRSRWAPSIVCDGPGSRVGPVETLVDGGTRLRVAREALVAAEALRAVAVERRRREALVAARRAVERRRKACERHQNASPFAVALLLIVQIAMYGRAAACRRRALSYSVDGLLLVDASPSFKSLSEVDALAASLRLQAELARVEIEIELALAELTLKATRMRRGYQYPDGQCTPGRTRVGRLIGLGIPLLIAARDARTAVWAVTRLRLPGSPATQSERTRRPTTCGKRQPESPIPRCSRGPRPYRPGRRTATSRRPAALGRHQSGNHYESPDNRGGERGCHRHLHAGRVGRPRPATRRSRLDWAFAASVIRSAALVAR
jgi:hypothetical protein